MSPLPRFLAGIVAMNSFEIEVEALTAEAAKQMALASYNETGDFDFEPISDEIEVRTVREIQR